MHTSDYTHPQSYPPFILHCFISIPISFSFSRLIGWALSDQPSLLNPKILHRCTNGVQIVRTDYPISSYYGLNAAMAIRLRNTYTGPTDFILDFLLPRDCKRDDEQKRSEPR
ncbi:unnamed protein product [Lactuca virosa]|uniref:NLP1-9 GAF domain-containing protein n=1 Tax=Lactuca virosa TaxID=75947 RepID=A0AAU9M0D7_9ASTR|nr:unnamed protein product [Lactuca virosa]